MDKKQNNTGHFQTCLKEFKICGILTMSYILICCALCYFLGYGKSGTEISFIMGIPSWAVYGVFIPWIIMVIVTAVYGFFIMEGDDK